MYSDLVNTRSNRQAGDKTDQIIDKNDSIY